MLRRLSTLASALSLTLCVATCVLWARGQWRSGWLSLNTAERCMMAGYGPRYVGVTFWDDQGVVVPPPFSAGSNPTPPEDNWDAPPNHAVRVLGFVYYSDRTSPSGRSRFGGNRPYWHVTIPYWMLVAALVAVPAGRLSRRVRRRLAHPPGCCAACGYDLRATPGRCPECGNVPPSPARLV